MSDQRLNMMLRLVAVALLAVICGAITLVCILQGGSDPDEEAQL